MGEGRQRAEDDVAEWEGKERQRQRQRQETSLRGTPGRQKPTPTETHRHPEWERDSQRNSTGKTHGTLSPAKRTALAWSGRREEVGWAGREKDLGKREQSPGKPLQLAAAEKSFCQKMVI